MPPPILLRSASETSWSGRSTISTRIADALAQGASGARILEVIVGSDGSADATEAIVADLAAGNPRVRLLALPRGGQTATQTALFAAAWGEAVVLTDAETRFAPGCLAALAGALRDPRVGCVTGRLEWRDEAATATSTQEGLYWRYERRVRELESRAGLLTATGRRPPRPIAFARSFAVVNLAFATGWSNVVRGRGIEVWHRTEVHLTR